MNFVDLIDKFGLYTVIILACGWFIYILVNKYIESAEKREDKLIEANREYSATLNKVADTLNSSNEVNKELSATNKELSETNRLLLDKVNTTLSDIKDDVAEVLHKLD